MSDCSFFKLRITKQFPRLISRIGRSKTPIVKSKFRRNRKIKLNNCSDQYFMILLSYKVQKQIYSDMVKKKQNIFG